MRKVKEFMPYFMLPKIALCRYEEEAESLIPQGPNSGCMSL
jgi:hypothetical protein